MGSRARRRAWLLVALCVALPAAARERLYAPLTGAVDGLALHEPWLFTANGLTVTLTAGQSLVALPGCDNLRDQRVGVSLTFRPGSPQLRAGLLFRASTPDSGWFVLLGADDGYQLGSLAGGRPTVLASGNLGHAAGKPVKRVELELRGRRATLTINGLPLGLPCAVAERGGVSLFARGAGSAAFTDLRLAEPPYDDQPRLSPNPQPTGPGVEPQPGGDVPAGPTHPGNSQPVSALPGGTRPLPVGPLIADPPLFEENFAPTPSHIWNRDEYRSISGPWLRLRAAEGYQLSGFPFGWTDFSYRATVKSASTGGGTYGLVVRLQHDGTSGYLCVVRDPDTFAIARLDHSKATVLLRGLVTLGAGEHQLRAVCVGDALAFFCDDRPLATVHDGTYPAGGLGVWVDNQREALFGSLLAVKATTADLPAAPAASRARTLVKETFDPPMLPWQQDAHRQLKDGALYLTAPDRQYVLAGLADARLSDYTTTLAVERLSGPVNGRVGLLARLQPDGRQGYLLAIAGDGAWSVLKLGSARGEVLTSGAARLKPGINTLSARCAGSALTFALNGAELARVQDGTWPRGGLGLYADNGVKARFTSLLAEELP